MIVTINRTATLAGLMLATALVAGCSPTTRGTTPVATGMPPPATPVATSNVQASDLPPIGGSASSSSTLTTQSSSDLYGSGNTQTAANDGFVTMNDINAPSTTTASGRDLTGAITIEKLLGGWTVNAGATQCRLNLTYTAKGATGRYRASTPACGQETLAEVTSWQLLGNQIQLYNESDAIVGTLLRSGDRFVGTLAGGQSISMEG